MLFIEIWQSGARTKPAAGVQKMIPLPVSATESQHQSKLCMVEPHFQAAQSALHLHQINSHASSVHIRVQQHHTTSSKHWSWPCLPIEKGSVMVQDSVTRLETRHEHAKKAFEARH